MNKLWIPLVVALAAVPAPVFAQTPPATRPAGGAPTPGGGQVARLFEGYRELLRSLDLSPQQQQAVSGVMQDAVAKMREMQGELQGLAPQERRAKIQGLVTELNRSIAAELTPEQVETFRAGLQELNRRNAGGGGETTRPAEGAPGRRTGAGAAQGNPRQMLESFRDAVHSLDLTEEQKTAVDAAMEDARTQLREAAQGGDPAVAREAFLRVSQELREKVGGLLTPEQRDALREKMRQSMGEGGRGNDRPGARERRPGRDAPKPESKPGESKPDTKPEAGGDDMMGGMGGAKDAAGGRAPAAPPSVAAQPAPKVSVGQPAPELTATRLDGTAVKLANYRNRPLVIVFGSYSSPTFREKAAMLNELAGDYRGRAEVVVVYIAEAHPVGTPEVERNRDDKVRVEAHKSAKERESAAKDAKAALKLEPTFLVDAITDDTAKAYGLAPNGVALLARDGTVYATQRWLEPFALRAMLDDMLAPAPK